MINMVIAANWKMNIGWQKAQEFLAEFNSLVKKEERGHFVFFPPASLSGLFQKESFYWGGQNIHHSARGAWTGENSAQTFKEMGADFCLLGHSERRSLGETDREVESKFYLALKLALKPFLCIGESANQISHKESFLKKQICWIKNQKEYSSLCEKPSAGLKHCPFVIAYEPLWAIGSGHSPSCKEIDKTTCFIKEYLAIPSVLVFYGGSVNEILAKEISSSSYLDGLLLGSASLNPQTLYSIYKKTSV